MPIQKMPISSMSHRVREAQEQALACTAGNTDTRIPRVAAHAGVKAPGRITRPAQAFAKTVRRRADGDVSLKPMENGEVKMPSAASNRVTKFRTLAPDRCPARSRPDGSPLQVPAATLMQALQPTCYGMTQEESRYARNGVRLDFSQSGLLPKLGHYPKPASASHPRSPAEWSTVALSPLFA